MPLTHIETRSAESHPRLRPSRFQEWNNIQFLGMLSKQLQSLREDELEFFELFDSDLAAITSVTETGADDDLRKVTLLFIEITPKLATENDTRILDDQEEELQQFRKNMYRALIGPRIDEEDEDLLDWDAHIETPPPPRKTSTIKVRFKYVGRSKPIPIEDPWA